jgi:hypothetical protein
LLGRHGSQRLLVKDRPWSTVWRVGDLWLKECKSIWRFEPRLTAALHARWPDRVAEVVEHGNDWMLMRDAGAAVEGLPHAQAVWLEAIARYAELQRGETAHVAEHLAAGVPDQRLGLLPAEYAQMLERDELPWRGDRRARLRRFEPRFAALCAALDDTASIQHDDLHIHNVYAGCERRRRSRRRAAFQVRSPEAAWGPRILDWGDSCVAHPFFSLVVTFVFVDASGHDAIRDAYLEAYGGDRAAFDLALRVGRIAHLFKWIRFRDVLPPAELPAYDAHFVGWIEQAVAQTSE